jgi:hypothetical protein
MVDDFQEYFNRKPVYWCKKHQVGIDMGIQRPFLVYETIICALEQIEFIVIRCKLTLCRCYLVSDGILLVRVCDFWRLEEVR